MFLYDVAGSSLLLECAPGSSPDPSRWVIRGAAVTPQPFNLDESDSPQSRTPRRARSRSSVRSRTPSSQTTTESDSDGGKENIPAGIRVRTLQVADGGRISINITEPGRQPINLVLEVCLTK